MSTLFGKLRMHARTLCRVCALAAVAADWRSRMHILTIYRTFMVGSLLAKEKSLPEPLPIYFAYGGRKASIGGKTLMDLAVLWEVFVAKEYALPPGHADPRTIIDLGSNIGASVLYFSLRYPDARIYAVEADPLIFARLTANVGDDPNITLIPAAIGAASGPTTFYRNEHHLSGSLVERDGTTARLEIPALSLDTLMDTYGIQEADVLKFDIEGGEYDTFRGFASRAKVALMIGEVHFDLIPLPREQVFASLFGTAKVEERPHGRNRSLVIVYGP